MIYLYMRKFFVEDEIKDFVVIENDFNHIINVLRKNIGDTIYVFNNKGIDYECEITKINKRNLEAKVLLKKENLKENSCKISVFQALIKNDKIELIVQKLTELNIDNLFLFDSEFTVVKAKDNKTDKLTKVSLEACKQCERSKSLFIDYVGDFNNLLLKLKEFDLVIFAYEKSLKKIKDYKFKDVKNVALIIGPEGGFSKIEQESLNKLSNVKEVSLSKNILRAETANIYLSGILMYEFN